MNRRQALQSGLAFAGATLVTKLAFAQTVPPKAPVPPAPHEPQAVIVSEIENNHGHAVVLSVTGALQLLRQTRGAMVTLNIQGQSRHPHALELVHTDLQKLFEDGVIEKESTEVAGHTHLVRIHLDIA